MHHDTTTSTRTTRASTSTSSLGIPDRNGQKGADSDTVTLPKVLRLTVTTTSTNTTELVTKTLTQAGPWPSGYPRLPATRKESRRRYQGLRPPTAPLFRILRPDCFSSH
eukprot:1033931-Rhodomonas_salina.1